MRAPVITRNMKGQGLEEYETLQINVKDPPFQARGDGVTDDTVAIQNALNLAYYGNVKRVHIPSSSSYYLITSELTIYENVLLVGDGVCSQIRQVTGYSNVLAAADSDNITICDLYLYGPGDASASTNGNGVFLNNCDRAMVNHIKCENMGLTGVRLMNSDYCWVKNNYITNGGKDSINAAGIYIGYSSSYNLVEGNIITNDKHGITVQSVDAGDYASYNIIIGNIIKTMDRYGIIIYNNAYVGHVYGNRIIGNNIRDVSDALTDNFGAGIYCNGVESITIADNYIENTNQGTTLNTLAPGAIGVTRSLHCVITGNTIENAQWHGITVRSASGVGSHYTISGNNISNSVKADIEVRVANNIIITDNIVYGGDDQGINAVGDGSHTNLLIADNLCTGAELIEINVTGYNNVGINNNVAGDSVTQNGINITNCDQIDIVGNKCNTNFVAGINIAGSNNTYVKVHKNTCTENDSGITVAAATDIVDFKDNIAIDNTWRDWSNGPSAAFTNADATPSVKGGRYFKTVGTTAITDFDDPYIGQVIYILGESAITITDGAPINLSGGANFDMVAGDTLTLVCKADLNWYETGRGNN